VVCYNDVVSNLVVLWKFNILVSENDATQNSTTTTVSCVMHAAKMKALKKMNATQPQSHKLPPLKPLSHAALHARHDMGLKNIDLDELVEQAFVEANVPPPIPRKRELVWESSAGKSVTWSSGTYGSVTIEIADGHTFGPIRERSINSWARILPNGKPTSLAFKTTYKQGKTPGTRVLFCQGGKILADVTESEIPVFRVPISWKDEVPHSDTTTDQDFSLILLAADCTFVQLEIATTTRNRYFWFSTQENWGGQIARTTKAKAERLNALTVEVDGHYALVAPNYPENNYPGADFLRANGMVHGIVEFAVKLGLSKTLSQCWIPKWETTPVQVPENMQKTGWKKAKVLFFNFAWGAGKLLCEDGQTCFVHFSQVVDEQGRPVGCKGEFPVLEPMTEIAVKWQENPRGRKATAVRII